MTTFRPEIYTLEGYPHRSVQSPDRILEHPYEGVATLYDNYLRALSLYPHNACLGTRRYNADGTRGEYEFSTFKQVAEKAENLASGLVNLGIRAGDRIGTYSINREEVVLAELAANLQSFTTVPLYDTLGEDAVEYVVGHAEIAVIICSRDKTDKVLAVASKLPKLRYVVQMEDFAQRAKVGDKYKASEDWSKYLAGTQVKLIELLDVFKSGQTGRQQHVPPKPDDLASILYTSGTTGEPKGVMILHRNMVSSVAGAIKSTPIYPTDVHLSYLPLAHIFERIVMISGMSAGASLGFYQGDVKKLVDDIAELKPTTFVGVPRVFHRIYDKIMQGINESPWPRRKLFYYAFQAKTDALRKGEETPYWDTIVFSKIKARFGGRIRVVISGSAPLSPTVQHFLRVCLGCPVLQGYGLSETCAVATVATPEHTGYGHVGVPSQCCEIKLFSVPEMEYNVTDVDEEGRPTPRGEVCVRGPNVFVGYYKMDEATKATFTEDGYLQTGDIGRWNPDGTLSIIDRKKNIFKLSQGEYIAAEKLEGVFTRSAYISQMFVYGDSYKSYLVGVVVLDLEALVPWAKQNLKTNDYSGAALCANPEVQQFIMQEITTQARNAKLRGFELVKAVHLEHAEFSIDNGLVTPTFKLKRAALKKHYEDVLSKLYEDRDAIKQEKHQSAAPPASFEKAKL